ESLASWLYGTARRLALKVRRGDARRRQRETESLRPTASSADPLDQLAARELLVILDEEMERLPEKYRLPLLLCGLQGRSQEEAARILGCTLGSLKGRLERGRKRLHARLNRRGLAFSGATLALGVSQAGLESATAQLTSTTLQAAMAFARGEHGGIAATVLALAKTGVSSMAITKAKLALVLLLMMGFAAGAGVLAYPMRNEKPPEAKPAAKSEPPKPETTKRERTDRFGDPLPPGALTRLGTIRLRHGGHAKSVAFTPDGKSLVSGGFDGWAFLWDVATGKRLRAFRGGSINSVAIDPKGKTVALADFSDGKVILYELATGKELATCPGHRGGTEIVVFSPDGKWLASAGKDKEIGGKDNRIRVWDAATLREVRSWQVDRVALYQLRFTPDGKGLAATICSGGTKNEFRFWDAATGEERPRRGPLADARLGTFCFSADGKTLLTGGGSIYGELLQLWDLATGKEIRTVARIEGGIKKIALTPDGKSAWVITDYWPGNHKPQQWDLSTGKQLLSLPHPSYIRKIEDFALSPDGKHLATGTYSHDVFLWDTRTGRRSFDFGGHRFLITSAAFTPDGQQLWTGGYDQTIRLWSAASGEQLRLLSQEGNKGGAVRTLALRPDGKMLAASLIHTEDNDPRKKHCDVRLWDLTSGKERQLRHGHGDWVTAIAFSPDGRILASRGEDPNIRQMLARRGEKQTIHQTIRLWDVAAGKERARLRCEEAGADGIAFSPDGRHVISALDKETIGFWDVQTSRLIRRLSVGQSSGNPIPLLSRDGRMLVTGGGEQPLRLWEVASGKERCRIELSNTETYVYAALSPDCRILAAWWAYGQPIKMWDLIAGKQLGELGDQTNMASPDFLSFSPDSRRLASTHSDGTVLIWDVASLLPKAATSARTSSKRLEELWNELASADAAKAYRAMRTLVASSARSVPLLRQRLPKTASTDVAKITRLLADLDSEQFEVRERASRGLQELGMLAEAAMRRRLRKQPSLEMRRRLEPILEKLETRERTAEELRTLRAVEVLEWIGSSEAQQVLREWSQGPADDWLTHEAKASLGRLQKRAEPRP
ncbi:MAG TPA: sigma factor-like helix-turn-helix DNA-binding protein, partial [Gemmataceae bacterium]|nr:sigma factor-like helix-turn-helix DNA-binding protein [Gemmataceae bacterium]